MRMKMIAVALIALGLVAGLVYLSQGEPSREAVAAGQADAETVLRQRAIDRWKAIMASDYASAYEYETPVYRAVNDLTTYMTRFAGQVVREAVAVERIEFDPADNELAIVVIAMDFSAVVNGQVLESVSYIRETWAKRDGQWWILAPE